MTYEEALRYYAQIDMMGSHLGLDRMAELLRRLGNPEKQLKFVHVAGTNGKGSTAALLDACLRQAGYRVGLYTSPHLVRYNERFQVNGQPISDTALAEATEQVKTAADTMEDAPTQFELLTCVCILLLFVRWVRHCRAGGGTGRPPGCHQQHSGARSGGDHAHWSGAHRDFGGHH